MGAEDEVRTRDPQLGRLMLYLLSYFRSLDPFSNGMQRYNFCDMPYMLLIIFSASSAEIGENRLKDVCMKKQGISCGDEVIVPIYLSVYNLSCVVLGVYLVDDLHQDAVLVKDECLSERTHGRLSIHILFSPCSESLKYFSRSVGQECER